jgi:hypothetical protein
MPRRFVDKERNRQSGMLLAALASEPERTEGPMISAWWLVPTFLIGGYAGMLVMAILSAAREVTKEPLPKRAVRAHLRRAAADVS